MKKILFVADSLEYGGVETTLVSWIQYLNTIKNVEITLLLLRKEGVFIKDIPKNVKIITIDEDSQKKLRPYRIQVIKSLKSLNMGNIWEIIKYIISAQICFKYKNMSLGEKIRHKVIDELDILDEKFDVAIAYSDHASMYYVCDKVIANKKILWIHADYGRVNRNLKANLYEYEQFDKIVCVSKVIKQNFLKECNHLKDRVDVINNILNEEKIKKLKNIKIPEFSMKYINILSVGRLEKEKNFATLIKAFYMLNKEVKQKVRLYIIGEGKDKKRLKKLIKHKNLEDKVFLLGAKENPYSYMNKCNIYIQPSLYEGFSTTVNEAKFLKRPIIVTNVGGMNELIQQDITGIILDENNEKCICENLQKLIIDENKREKLTKNLEYNTSDKILKEKFLEVIGIEEI